MTRWSRFDATLPRSPLARGRQAREADAEARFVVAHAEQGFTSNIPLAALEDDDALIAWEADGEPLTPDHGWPLRLVVPVALLLEERQVAARPRAAPERPPGFWERYGYHNDADYWKEQRYGF